MQHSFFTNLTQSDTWRQIQLRKCILFFQASVRNCKNCVHNEDHSLFDFHIRDSMYNIIHISFHHLSTPHGLTRAHKWPTSNVSGFIAQLVRASNRCREVTGSKPIEVLFTIAKITTFFDLRSITDFEQSARIVEPFTACFGRFYSTTRPSVAPQIIRQSGCANLIDSHISLQSLNGCNWNTVA